MLGVGHVARARLPRWRVWHRLYSSSLGAVLDLNSPVQSYVSTQRDPYLNLSIEHHLLEKSSPESTILFLYINRPCIVIGRNQNPWVEVNIPLLRASNGGASSAQSSIKRVDLVRRRSGGGTVFHDEGNVNWSVICPPSDFTRDKHAEMVVKALRGLGIRRARVNERHDIVLDQSPDRISTDVDPQNMHRTAYTSSEPGSSRALKVSGSAYKLTRLRSLHHATCLLSSPNLNLIQQYLHSPARPFIRGRGVDSVSSPVGNIGANAQEFAAAVQDHFRSTYGSHETPVGVGEELLRNPDIAKGYMELKSLDWIYGQTPQFDVSSDSWEKPDQSETPSGPNEAREGRLSMTIRHGTVETVSHAMLGVEEASVQKLNGYKLYGMSEDKMPRLIWNALSEIVGSEQGAMVEWLRHKLETPKLD